MKKIIQTVFPFWGSLNERYAVLEAKNQELEQVIFIRNIVTVVKNRMS